VIPLGGVSLTLEPKDRGLKSVEHEGDQAGRIGLEGELGHAQHQLELFKEESFLFERGRGSARGRWSGTLLPLAQASQSTLDFANGGEVLVEALPVSQAKVGREAAGLLAQGVENAAASIDSAQARLDRSLISLAEHPRKDRWRIIFRRQQHTVACPGEAAIGLLDIDSEIDRRDPGEMSDLLGRVLIE